MQYDFFSPTITKSCEKTQSLYIVYMVASKSTIDRNKCTVLLSVWYLYFCQFIFNGYVSTGCTSAKYV